MSIQGDEPGRQVRFGATITAVGHALRMSGPAVLIAWVVHAALSSVSPILNANHLVVPPLPFGPTGWTLGLPVAAALAVVSGLLIRWLVLRDPAALRLDGRLAGYVGLIVASVMITSFASYAILPAVRGGGGGGAAQLGARAALVGLANLVITLIFALMALWPVTVLMGDRLSPGAAIARMRQAYFTFLGLSFLLILPGVALVDARLFTRHAPLDLTDRLLSVVVGALTTAVSSVLLAQIYSRRVRGCDLGSEPVETVGDVFA